MPDDISAAPESATAGLAAQEVIRLWPDGAPRGLPDVPAEIAYRTPAMDGSQTTMLRNVSDPTLTVYRPAPGKANGVGVIVCPGGGWRILAWTHEGVDLAHWLAERGYTAFLLKYRVMATPPDAGEFAALNAAMAKRMPAEMPAAKAPRSINDLMRDELGRYAREVAADDGRRALAIVRERAADWGVDPARVGMIGFSAGAFLTVDVALETGGAPLAFVAPIYGGETGGKPVTSGAPPLFTCIAQDDRILFKVVEGLYADWSNADRPAELHIFARGQHGFGMLRRGLPVDRWIDLLEAWLADQGFA